MSGTYSKSILKVGTYHSPDGVVHVTPERLRHWEQQTKRLQSVGYAIPSHFDHANEIDLLEPIAMDVLSRGQNRSAQATVGRLDRFTVAPDGKSAEIVLHTLTPGAKEVVENNAVFVSPVIFPEWKDGAGNKYRDVITSFDLVDHPVDHSQSSFVPAIKMGLRVCPAIRMGLGKPHFLERNGMPTKNRSIVARKQRFKSALRAGLVRMGSDYDPSEDEESAMEAEFGTADDTPTADETGTPSDDASPTDTMDVDTSEAPDLLDSVLNLLHEFGVTLPDDTTDANLIPHLRVALTALLNADNGEDEVEDEGVEDMTDDGMPGAAPGGMPVASAPNIATMSVQQRKIVERASVLERKLQDQHREATKASLASLLKSGRCTPAEHDSYLRTLGAVRMSLTDDGSFKPNRVDAFIEDRKAVPQGTFWTNQQRSAPAQLMSVVEPPSAWKTGGGTSTREIKDAINALGGKA